MRSKVEPWLSAIFQSEHLSLLLGNGLTVGVMNHAGVDAPSLGRVTFQHKYAEQVKNAAQNEAARLGRGSANFEDDLRSAIELQKGLEIIEPEAAAALKEDINKEFASLLTSIYATEGKLHSAPEDVLKTAVIYLKSFLMSFASRAASRDRLHIFTTNYDRLIEFGCDQAAILLIDRFVGKIEPVLRTTRVELDYHYNPPGIRGEPRYVEGVVRLTKLHGSIDWQFNGSQIKRIAIPFGGSKDYLQDSITDPLHRAVIFPNPAKDIETAFYPYSELFRDFGSATSRPNSVLVTYGYSFGDSHINRVIQDMLTTPSTHLVIIAFDDQGAKIQNFVEAHNSAQITILFGKDFASLETLVEKLLPKPAIDPITERQRKLLERRGSVDLSASEAQQKPS